MSDLDAIERLTSYLNQTRRQAEVAIDHLNNDIKVKDTEIENLKAVAEHLEGERDYFRNLSEQLKLENGKKWRLGERDDWKALVESIQADRTRLNDEVARLEAELLNLHIHGSDGNINATTGASAGAGGHSEGKENEQRNINAAFEAEYVAKLEREVEVSRKRITHLEKALHESAAPGSGISGVSASLLRRTHLHHPNEIRINTEHEQHENNENSRLRIPASPVSSASMSGTGRSYAAPRVVKQQRKFAEDNSRSIWSLSWWSRGSKEAPHEKKTATGVLFV